MKQLVCLSILGVVVIDSEGYRLNVGIIVFNSDGLLLWAKRRFNNDAWQFPQGGIKEGETSLDAMYRELDEELGLSPSAVELVKESAQWYAYKLPNEFIRRHSHPVCIGQKQRWYLLKLLSDESDIDVTATEHPEFSEWRWVEYWQPHREVVHFKKQVYFDVLTEFESLVP